MGKLSDHLGSNSNSSDAAVPSSESRNPFRRAMNAFSGGNNQQQSLGTDAYQPPPGPPPSHSEKTSYAPPPGPPPSHDQKTNYNEKTSDPEPPPYDPWLSVPDSSTLPPPPSLSYETSPTSNASAEWADSARAWTRAHPLYRPHPLREGELSEINAGHLALTKPPNVRAQLTSSRPGTWRVATAKGTQDAILLTSLPMFAATHHDPRHTGRSYTAYFEMRITKLDLTSSASGEVDSAVALGFVAPPYPAWRLPGWERASLGVHGDDGRRYINNNMGGMDFTTSFNEGEVVGIGMVWEDARGYPIGGVRGRNKVKVFLTRDGRKVGGWDLYEERDAGELEGDPEGLGGDRDICGAVGLFGAVEFEWRGRRDEWLYRPDLH
ncbi:hypothetical protein BDZ85DRAFT_268444 [Elsinoe ampelina]|uniref:SPRY domain-containing protein n=1 Tax=Elsinoe ampelina TaxID=302913 RepID=A0A6A6G113_9PEZI|nr:hypothetical protein BDZ85DRAFT_268444 [Elsinoe ampelina]